MYGVMHVNAAFMQTDLSVGVASSGLLQLLELLPLDI